MLYHGTSVVSLPQTLRYGIRPRKQRVSNWKHAPSHPEMVYLTSIYPFYFAFPNSEKMVGVVFEIDTDHLDTRKLHPDEDYLYNRMYERDRKLPTKEQHQQLRADLDLFQPLWHKSLALLGTCAYRGTVPRRALTRYCLFNAALRPELASYCTDASINFLNCQMQGPAFRQLVSWFFGYQELLPMVEEAETATERNFWNAQSEDRTGIKVVDLRNVGRL